MKLLIQRVSEASVTIDGAIVGEIGKGLLCFVCAVPGDTAETVDFLAAKVAKLRIFSDPEGKMNLSVADVGGEVLAVSQFTLAARWKKGNRPGFTDAADPAMGEKLYDDFRAALAAQGLTVAAGRFGADMKVALINDGPITIWIDSDDPK